MLRNKWLQLLGSYKYQYLNYRSCKRQVCLLCREGTCEKYNQRSLCILFPLWCNWFARYLGYKGESFSLSILGEHVYNQTLILSHCN